MLQIVQAYDRSPIAEVATDGADALEAKQRLSATTLRPTVLLQPPASSQVSCEEVFGPITCIYCFTNLDDANEGANGLPVAFQASIFTQADGPALRARTDWTPRQ
jgi:acyl-CoA reductase-like NAD-dependent aldehyde dehydrogenase